MANKYEFSSSNAGHSNGWIAQVWLSFVISVSATAIGIFYLPLDPWVKGYLAMGLMFSVGSTVSLSKTTRDIHESSRLISKVEEAKIEKILAEHGPLA
jgi:hypothetical protein